MGSYFLIGACVFACGLVLSLEACEALSLLKAHRYFSS